MSQDIYKKYFKIWFSEFKSKLYSTNIEFKVIFIINEDFFKKPKERGNLNKKILKENIIDYKNANFLLLNKELWNLIKSNYPNEIELKCQNPVFFHNKFIFIIKEYIYYFYFINENNNYIEEGYFEFKSYIYADKIINLFYNLRINEFLNMMKIKKTNEEQIIDYDGDSYIFKIKGKKNQNIKNKEKKSEFHHCLFSNQFNNNNNHNQNNNNINGNQMYQRFPNNGIQDNFFIKKIIFPKKFSNSSGKNQKRFYDQRSHSFESGKNDILSLHSKGLENIVSHCNMNPVLQCLSNIKPLTKYLIKPENKQKILANKSKNKLTNSYIEVLNNLWQNSKIKYYSPNDFIKIVNEMNPFCKGKLITNYSKFFLLFILEKMHNELNKVTKINEPTKIFNQYDYEETFKIFRNHFVNNYKSIISDLFYGMNNSMITCFNCKKTIHNIQCFNILSFLLEEIIKFKNKIENIINIEECFEYYEKDNLISEYYCNNCNCNSNGINKTKLLISPNILVINLNRGKELEFDIKIKFKENLDLKKYIYYEKCQSYYNLIGIVTFFGPSSGSKFIAFCKSFVNQKWYKYNDTHVDISSFKEASTTGIPIILFYSSK